MSLPSLEALGVSCLLVFRSRFGRLPVGMAACATLFRLRSLSPTSLARYGTAIRQASRLILMDEHLCWRDRFGGLAHLRYLSLLSRSLQISRHFLDMAFPISVSLRTWRSESLFRTSSSAARELILDPPLESRRFQYRTRLRPLCSLYFRSAYCSSKTEG
jgi:hypothetical protein